MPETTPVKRRRLSANFDFRFLDFEFVVLIGPNRSELRQNSGRAPIVKISRMIPPTPVAAPWNGSIALGWLWLSILNAIAQPSPMSTTPAFSSPALTRMFGPVVGNFLSSFFEFLYEQCSLHMTEKM